MSGSGRVLASGDRLAQALELGLAVLDRPQPPVPVVQALEGTLEGPSRRGHGGLPRPSSTNTTREAVTAGKSGATPPKPAFCHAKHVWLGKPRESAVSPDQVPRRSGEASGARSAIAPDRAEASTSRHASNACRCGKEWGRGANAANTPPLHAAAQPEPAARQGGPPSTRTGSVSPNPCRLPRRSASGGGDRLDAPGVVVGGLVDQGAHGMGGHRVRRVRAERHRLAREPRLVAHPAAGSRACDCVIRATAALAAVVRIVQVSIASPGAQSASDPVYAAPSGTVHRPVLPQSRQRRTARRPSSRTATAASPRSGGSTRRSRRPGSGSAARARRPGRKAWRLPSRPGH